MRAHFEIRDELPADALQVREVNVAAFGQPDEANLVEELRELGAIVLSLVAVRESEVVGHIVFSEVSFEGAGGAVRGIGLAPMAVRPDLQGSGVGSALVRAGLDRCRDLGYEIAVVLGHRRYYPRFGFVPAEELSLECPWRVPAGVFMGLALAPDAAARVQGRVHYHPAFGLPDPPQSHPRG